MGTLHRKDFSLGWSPSSDLLNGDPRGLLRADNMRLDIEGVLSLRQGSAVITSLAALDVHSLFTTIQGGIRQRCVGASSSVYINAALIQAGINGSAADDIAFGAHQGQILWARGSTRSKYDGANLWNWGIDEPAAAPVLAAIPPDGKSFSTFQSGEAPAWTADEGSITFVTGQDGTVNGALALTSGTALPPGTAGAQLVRRGTITKKWETDQDFTAYDAGDTGIDEDLIEIPIWMQDPDTVQEIAIMIDCNTGKFDEDFFYTELDPARPGEVKLDPRNALQNRTDVTASEVDDIVDNALGSVYKQGRPRHPLTIDRGSETGGWRRFSIARGNFLRTGSTPEKGWKTIRAVRIVVKATGVVRFDLLRINGGAAHPLTGKFAVKVVYVRNDGTYEAKSGPSPASNQIDLKCNGLQATINTAGIDAQVNEIWCYLMGGGLKQFFRTKVSTDASAPVVINMTMSEVDAAKANIPLEEDNDRPPEDIIAVFGPHYDRTMVLTASLLSPSRERNPDSYAAGQGVKVGDAAEENRIGALLNGNVLVGTSKGWYRIEGDWTLLPDGVLNIRKVPVPVPPPINDMWAQDGANGVYMAADGPRLFNGFTSEPIRGSADLIFRGFTRYEVPNVNLGSAPGRATACLVGARLKMSIPEEPSTTSTHVFYEYDLNRKVWYRDTARNVNWRRIYKEPDGKVLAGDDEGHVWQLELDSATTGDNGTAIAVEVWTKSDDNGEPLRRKDAYDIRVQLDTGGLPVTVGVYLDEAAAASLSTVATTTGSGIHMIPIPEALKFKRIQLRFSGNLETFKLYDFTVQYRERPVPRVYWDSGHVDLAQSGGDHRMVSWIRGFLVKANAPGNLRLRTYFGGTLRDTSTIVITPDVTDVYTVDLPSGIKGRQPLYVIDSAETSPEEAQAFELYWVEPIFRGSGAASQKPRRRVVVG